MFNNEFLLRLANAIDAHFVTYRNYVPWCDELIMSNDDLPAWVYDLSIKKYIPEVVSILNRAAYDSFDEAFESDGLADFWICCNYLRYKRREISWATFLREAGDHADENQTEWDCEEYYHLLNNYEESYFLLSLETEQSEYFRKTFSRIIDEANAFMKHFPNENSAQQLMS